MHIKQTQHAVTFLLSEYRAISKAAYIRCMSAALTASTVIVPWLAVQDALAAPDLPLPLQDINSKAEEQSSSSSVDAVDAVDAVEAGDAQPALKVEQKPLQLQSEEQISSALLNTYHGATFANTDNTYPTPVFTSTQVAAGFNSGQPTSVLNSGQSIEKVTSEPSLVAFNSALPSALSLQQFIPSLGSQQFTASDPALLDVLTSVQSTAIISDDLPSSGSVQQSISNSSAARQSTLNSSSISSAARQSLLDSSSIQATTFASRQAADFSLLKKTNDNISVELQKRAETVKNSDANVSLFMGSLPEKNMYFYYFQSSDPDTENIFVNNGRIVYDLEQQLSKYPNIDYKNTNILIASAEVGSKRELLSNNGIIVLNSYSTNTNLDQRDSVALEITRDQYNDATLVDAHIINQKNGVIQLTNAVGMQIHYLHERDGEADSENSMYSMQNDGYIGVRVDQSLIQTNLNIPIATGILFTGTVHNKSQRCIENNGRIDVAYAPGSTSNGIGFGAGISVEFVSNVVVEQKGIITADKGNYAILTGTGTDIYLNIVAKNTTINLYANSLIDGEVRLNHDTTLDLKEGYKDSFILSSYSEIQRQTNPDASFTPVAYGDGIKLYFEGDNDLTLENGSDVTVIDFRDQVDSISNTLRIEEQAKFLVHKNNSALQFTNTNLINYGEVEVNGSQTAQFDRTVQNLGTLQLNNRSVDFAGELINDSQGKINVSGDNLTFRVTGDKFINQGTINFSGNNIGLGFRSDSVVQPSNGQAVAHLSDLGSINGKDLTLELLESPEVYIDPNDPECKEQNVINALELAQFDDLGNFTKLKLNNHTAVDLTQESAVSNDYFTSFISDVTDPSSAPDSRNIYFSAGQVTYTTDPNHQIITAQNAITNFRNLYLVPDPASALPSDKTAVITSGSKVVVSDSLSSAHGSSGYDTVALSGSAQLILDTNKLTPSAKASLSDNVQEAFNSSTGIIDTNLEVIGSQSVLQVAAAPDGMVNQWVQNTGKIISLKNQGLLQLEENSSLSTDHLDIDSSSHVELGYASQLSIRGDNDLDTINLNNYGQINNLGVIDLGYASDTIGFKVDENTGTLSHDLVHGIDGGGHIILDLSDIQYPLNELGWDVLNKIAHELSNNNGNVEIKGVDFNPLIERGIDPKTGYHIINCEDFEGLFNAGVTYADTSFETEQTKNAVLVGIDATDHKLFGGGWLGVIAEGSTSRIGVYPDTHTNLYRDADGNNNLVLNEQGERVSIELGEDSVLNIQTKGKIGEISGPGTFQVTGDGKAEADEVYVLDNINDNEFADVKSKRFVVVNSSDVTAQNYVTQGTVEYSSVTAMQDLSFTSGSTMNSAQLSAHNDLRLGDQSTAVHSAFKAGNQFEVGAGSRFEGVNITAKSGLIAGANRVKAYSSHAAERSVATATNSISSATNSIATASAKSATNSIATATNSLESKAQSSLQTTSSLTTAPSKAAFATKAVASNAPSLSSVSVASVSATAAFSPAAPVSLTAEPVSLAGQSDSTVDLTASSAASSTASSAKKVVNASSRISAISSLSTTQVASSENATASASKATAASTVNKNKVVFDKNSVLSFEQDLSIGEIDSLTRAMYGAHVEFTGQTQVSAHTINIYGSQVETNGNSRISAEVLNLHTGSVLQLGRVQSNESQAADYYATNTTKAYKASADTTTSSEESAANSTNANMDSGRIDVGTLYSQDDTTISICASSGQNTAVFNVNNLKEDTLNSALKVGQNSVMSIGFDSDDSSLNELLSSVPVLVQQVQQASSDESEGEQQGAIPNSPRLGSGKQSYQGGAHTNAAFIASQRVSNISNTESSDSLNSDSLNSDAHNAETTTPQGATRINTAVVALNTAIKLGAKASIKIDGNATHSDEPTPENTMILQNKGTLLLTDEVFQKNSTTAAVTFTAQEQGQVISDEGQILIAGDFNTLTTYNLFDNADLKQAEDLKVFSANGLWVGILDENGDFKLSLGNGNDIASRIFTNASVPVERMLYDALQSTDESSGSVFLRHVAVNGQGLGIEAEKAARLAVYAGAVQSAVAASEASVKTITDHQKQLEFAGSDLVTANSSLWLTPTLRRLKSDGFANEGVNYGADVELSGLTLGIDHACADNINLGLAFNVGTGSTDGVGTGSGLSDEFDYFGFSIYADMNLEQFKLSGNITYTQVDSDFDGYSGLSDYGILNGSTTDNVFSIGLAISKQWNYSGVNIEPHAGVRYTCYDFDDYTVKSAQGSLAEIEQHRGNVFSIPVGIAMSRDFIVGDWSLKPQADLTLTANLGDTDLQSNVQFGSIQAQLNSEIMDKFAYRMWLGIEISRSNFSLGAGAAYAGSANTDEFSLSIEGNYRF